MSETSGPSQAAAYACAHALLQETFAYLLRLPAVPTTTELARRIRTHIEDPAVAASAALAREEVAAHIWKQTSRTWAWRYLSSGIPELVVQWRADQVRLHSPAAQVFGNTSKGRSFALHLSQHLARGITVPDPHDSAPSSGSTVAPNRTL